MKVCRSARCELGHRGLLVNWAHFVLDLYTLVSLPTRGAPTGSNGSMLDHISLPPVFGSRRGHIWRLVHLWLRFITFGGRSVHLAYRVHKNGRKTSIIIILPTRLIVNSTHSLTNSAHLFTNSAPSLLLLLLLLLLTMTMMPMYIWNR